MRKPVGVVGVRLVSHDNSPDVSGQHPADPAAVLQTLVAHHVHSGRQEETHGSVRASSSGSRPTVSGDGRRLELLERVLGGRSEFETRRLCGVCAEVTGATGAGIMLMSGDIPRGSVCTSDEVSALIEQLQYDLCEGPCVDAYTLERPVLEPDLVHPRSPRWPAFTDAAIAAGVRAMFGFPLQVGAIRLGALNLYADTPRPLTDVQHADALLLAGITAQAVLLLQADAPAGTLAAELEANANFQHVVHQASGMVAAQLDVSVGQALVRLRAHAFGNGRNLTDVARDVVDRRLRFDAQSGEKDPAP